MALTTVIIPTAGALVRRNSLRKAIDSVLSQMSGDAIPLVVLNGTLYDEDCRYWLRSYSRVRYHYMEQGGLPGAIEEGRKLVDTEYFSYLDDDDLYLPNALAIRQGLIQSECGYDVAVTSGYRDYNGTRSIVNIGETECNANCLLELADFNWLSSCAGLFRTESVSPEYFRDVMRFAEWTDIAFRLAYDRRIRFSDTPTFVVRVSSTGLSAHNEFKRAPVELVRKFLSNPLPQDVHRAFQRKLADALHFASTDALASGDLSTAWRSHLQSIATPSGRKYILYTRRLIYACFSHYVLRRN